MSILTDRSRASHLGSVGQEITMLSMDRLLRCHPDGKNIVKLEDLDAL
jgi:hypothetical protein